jgi:hypothetical protein
MVVIFDVKCILLPSFRINPSNLVLADFLLIDSILKVTRQIHFENQIYQSIANLVTCETFGIQFINQLSS